MDDPSFRGINGQFDRTRFEDLIRQIGFTEQRFLAEQRRSMLRQQLVGTVSGELAVPKTALDALNRFQNEQRTIDYVMLDRAQAGDVAEPTPGGARQVFRGAQGAVPRARIPQGPGAGADAG